MCVVGLDYPYITTLLSNNTIEVHSVESQSIVQVISTPYSAPASPALHTRVTQMIHLVSCLNGYLVPSSQRSDKMRLAPVRLIRQDGPKSEGMEDAEPVDTAEIN
jgi:hypothetical protein